MELLSDRYQIQTQLGKKAGRQTFLAKDLETQELVVVKCLIFGSDFEWDDLKLFEREAETLKSLDHPAIPEYLDYFELELPSGRGFALVQSYIEAKSLEQHLKAGRSFTETEVKQLAEALLDILIYLHNQQPSVIHRDIKPSNILLSDRSGNYVGDVYLVDFGSVQTLVAQEGGTITVVGTYGYMPPEQYGGRATPASDVYSLGATLIYLITGKHPADLPQRNLKLEFREFATASSTLIDWLDWMTEPGLDNRLESAEEALEALQDGLMRSLDLFDSGSKTLPRMTFDQLFWNATWRMSSIGGLIGTLLALLGPSAAIAISFEAAVLASCLVGGVGVGLGFVNGLLIATLTRNYFSWIRSPWRYRFTMALSTMGFSSIGALLLGLSVSTSTTAQFFVVIAAAPMILTMGLTSQWFAEWYIRVSSNLLLNQRLSLPQSAHQSAHLTSRSGQPIVPLSGERVIWNAISRNTKISIPFGGVMLGGFAFINTVSKAYSTPLDILLNVVSASAQGGCLFLAIAFFNGLATGFISSRFFPQARNRKRYRVTLAVCAIAITTLCLQSVGILLSPQWLPVQLIILISNVVAVLSSQLFASWYIRETRDRS